MTMSTSRTTNGTIESRLEVLQVQVLFIASLLALFTLLMCLSAALLFFLFCYMPQLHTQSQVLFTLLNVREIGNRVENNRDSNILMLLLR